MKRIILFGIGKNGKTIVDTYTKYGADFDLAAIADNGTILREYKGIPVISPKDILKFAYDEVWISTIFYQEIERQLVEELQINVNKIRYVEYPMPFLEKRIYEKYKEEIAGLKKCRTKEMQDVIDYVAQNGVKMYCYPFYEEYQKIEFPVYFDEEYQLFYGMYRNHKMYFSSQFDTEKKAETYFRYVCMEQDQRSPHCYLTKQFCIGKREIGIDIGAAEGIFALELIDLVEHMYLIEADADWCRALALTFQDYREKVTVIQGCVSDLEDSAHTTLDTLFAGKRIDFIKMDIEGAELQALYGAENLINDWKPKLAVCTYHNAGDYGNIAKWLMLKGYSINTSEGYVVCQGEWELQNINAVDFRKALLWAERDTDEKTCGMHT